MQSQILYALDLARERQQRAIDQASIDQGAERARPSIRRSLGHRVIAVGQRIAAEPSLERARSR
jgi:hypothetical protein